MTDRDMNDGAFRGETNCHNIFARKQFNSSSVTGQCSRLNGNNKSYLGNQYQKAFYLHLYIPHSR